MYLKVSSQKTARFTGQKSPSRGTGTMVFVIKAASFLYRDPGNFLKRLRGRSAVRRYFFQTALWLRSDGHRAATEPRAAMKRGHRRDCEAKRGNFIFILLLVYLSHEKGSTRKPRGTNYFF